MKARPTTIVDKGFAKALLHTRALIPNTTASSGNRRGASAMPTNVLLTSEKSVSSDQLKAQLIQIVKARGKEYGILVRKTGNFFYSASIGRPSTIIITRGGAGRTQMHRARSFGFAPRTHAAVSLHAGAVSAPPAPSPRAVTEDPS